MVTRFYLHAATNSTSNLPTTRQSSVSVVGSPGTNGSPSINRQMDITIGTTQTSQAQAGDGANNIYYTRFVSALLAAQTISANTWTINFAFSGTSGAAPSNPRACIFVWRPGTGKVADVADTSTGVSANASGERVVTFTVSGSAVTAQANDVLCYEAYCDTSSAGASQSFFYDGTTVNTTYGASVTNHASFIETPQTITFPSGTVATTVTSKTVTNKIITKV